MSQAGWYPDPGGASGQFRLWDGATWHPTTSPTPGTPEGPGRPSISAGLALAVVVVALVAVVLTIWRAPGGLAGGALDPTSATPTVTGRGATPTAPPTASDDPSSGGSAPNPCPLAPSGAAGDLVAGRMQSGDLSVATIASWDQARPKGLYVAGVADVVSQSKLIATNWRSHSAVATAPHGAFTTPQRAAQTLAECFASSDYYPRQTGVQGQTDRAVTIDGHRAHWVRVEVRVDFSDPTIAGDVIDVIVVDTDVVDRFGVYIAAVTIGDHATRAEVDTVIAGIRVVG